jgi:hypothetical protein
MVGVAIFLLLSFTSTDIVVHCVAQNVKIK